MDLKDIVKMKLNNDLSDEQIDYLLETARGYIIIFTNQSNNFIIPKKYHDIWSNIACDIYREFYSKDKSVSEIKIGSSSTKFDTKSKLESICMPYDNVLSSLRRVAW